MELPWRVKLRQAEEHLSKFEVECNAYLETAHVELTYDSDTAAGTIKVVLHADSEPPMRLGAIVGDVLHNLRSALDSIAWETCQRAGVPEARESKVYFPIGDDPANWGSLAGRQLPSIDREDVKVFKALQPWYWDDQARSHGVQIDVPDSARRHPLHKLHVLARNDRHRVPQPILARAGHTWLETPEGITVASVTGSQPPWSPGNPFLTWAINPPNRVSDVHPAGEAMLALSEESACWQHSALEELQGMRDSVAQSLRTIEIEVLQVVTPDQMEELSELHSAFRDKQDTLNDLLGRPHIIDKAYMDDYSKASSALESARQSYTSRWRELFE
jgi:hypothetical protein